MDGVLHKLPVNSAQNMTLHVNEFVEDVLVVYCGIQTVCRGVLHLHELGRS